MWLTTLNGHSWGWMDQMKIGSVDYCSWSFLDFKCWENTCISYMIYTKKNSTNIIHMVYKHTLLMNLKIRVQKKTYLDTLYLTFWFQITSWKNPTTWSSWNLLDLHLNEYLLGQECEILLLRIQTLTVRCRER